jgi:hypothetical protein
VLIFRGVRCPLWGHQVPIIWGSGAIMGGHVPALPSDKDSSSRAALSRGFGGSPIGTMSDAEAARRERAAGVCQILPCHHHAFLTLVS